MGNWLGAAELFTFQQHTTFHMISPRKLIKQRSLSHAVGVAELTNILSQGFWVAGNIQNSIKATNQLTGITIHTRARWINKHSTKLITVQINIGQTTKIAHLV